MVIACPQCETSFEMPASAYRPGRKARCSQCRHVFTLPEATPSSTIKDMLSPSMPSAPPKATLSSILRGRSFLYTVAGIVCLLGLSVSSYMFYVAYNDRKAIEMVQERRVLRQVESEKNKERDLAVDRIDLFNVRQTVVENQKMGPLVVIEGYAQNNFDSPRSFIEVEARLLDKSGKVLASMAQPCGISLNLVQLQVLSRDELVRLLNNEVDIWSRNVDVPPGGQVPFIVLFQGLPKELYSFEVRPARALAATPPQP